MEQADSTNRVLHTAAYYTLAGMLYALISQGQKGKPLTPEEMKTAFDEGESILTSRLKTGLAALNTVLEERQNQ